MTYGSAQLGLFTGGSALFGLGPTVANLDAIEDFAAIPPIAIDDPCARLPAIQSKYTCYEGSDVQAEIEHRWQQGFHRSFLVQDVAQKRAKLLSKDYENRRLRGIRTTVARLSTLLPGADQDQIIAFARGHKALAAYKNLLSDEGLALLQIVDRKINDPHITEESIKALLHELPSAGNPKLELYHNPFTEDVRNSPEFAAFRKVFGDKNSAYRVIQIATGCRNGCLMCGACADQNDVQFMPYPIVLYLLKELADTNPDAKVQFYDSNDVLQWRDENFDTDFGDLAMAVKAMGWPSVISR